MKILKSIFNFIPLVTFIIFVVSDGIVLYNIGVIFYYFYNRSVT